jgi:hypothetical protein
MLSRCFDTTPSDAVETKAAQMQRLIAQQFDLVNAANAASAKPRRASAGAGDLGKPLSM